MLSDTQIVIIRPKDNISYARFDKFTLGASYQSSFKPDGDSYEIKNFNNGELVFENRTDGWNLEYPSFFQFGLAYDHSDKLNFAADLQFRKFEDYKINGEKAFDELKNGLKIGLGAEFHYSEDWTFQLGAALDRNPIADFEDESPVSSLTFGGGLVTDLNRFFNLDAVEALEFNGFITANTWGRKVNDESEEYCETLWVLGSGLRVIF